jgi:hypothetical protein
MTEGAEILWIGKTKTRDLDCIGLNDFRTDAVKIN